MAKYSAIKAAVNAYIKANGRKEITGSILNAVLNATIDSLGKYFQFAGVATPTTDPENPDQNVCYLAGEPGTYTNFDNIVLENEEIALLFFDGTWSKQRMLLGIQEVIATVDDTVGTPSVDVDYSEGQLELDFHNIKGQKGDTGAAAGFGTIGATIDGNIGTPGVSVQESGPATAKNLVFNFTNLKGETGVTSVVATIDNGVGTPTCEVSLVGQQLTLAFHNLKGEQGNTGSSVDYPFEIVNNLTTNDSTKALSAAQGVALKGEVDQLEAKVIGLRLTDSHTFSGPEEYFYFENLNIASGKTFKVKLSGTAAWNTGLAWVISNLSSINPGLGVISQGGALEITAPGAITKLGLRIYNLATSGTVDFELELEKGEIYELEEEIQETIESEVSSLENSDESINLRISSGNIVSNNEMMYNSSGELVARYSARWASSPRINIDDVFSDNIVLSAAAKSSIENSIPSLCFFDGNGGFISCIYTSTQSNFAKSSFPNGTKFVGFNFLDATNVTIQNFGVEGMVKNIIPNYIVNSYEGGANKALSSEKGGELNQRVTELEEDIDGTSTIVEETFSPGGIGEYINSSGYSVGDTFNKDVTQGSHTGLANYKIAVQGGDVVNIYAYGNGNVARLYILTNSQNVIVSLVGNKDTHITPEVLNIEADGWLYVNDMDYSSDVGRVVINRTVRAAGLEERLKEYVDDAVAPINRLKGKNILIFGDSLSTTKDASNKTYADYVAEITGANIINIAIGGTRFAQRSTPTLTPTSYSAWGNIDICNMVYAVCENDFSYADVAVETLSRFADTIALAKTIVPNNIDIVILEGGTNDYLNGDNIGTEDSTDKGTTLGALNYMIQKLCTTFPKAKIIGESNQVLYSIPPIFDASDSYVVGDVVMYNDGGGWNNYKFINNHSGVWDANDVVEATDLDWRKPELFSDNDERLGGLTSRELIGKFAERFGYYHIPYANVYETMGWNEYNFSSHFPNTDNHHPNDMLPWAEHLIGYLEKL